ncbi:MAG: SDR family NAD(P)-dependent oxidoreductase [Acidobacteriota bacterium]
MSEFTDKIVLITGAHGGLGTFVSEAFLEAGATVIGVARSIQQSAFSSSRFVAMPGDLTRGEATQTLADAVVSRFERVDALVHVLGGFAGGELVDNTDDATWDKMMNLNLRSAFNICRSVLPVMRRAKRGSITAIGARSAVEPKACLSAYCTSKAAMVALIRTVALEGKEDGIRANVVLPGTMDTPANRADFPSADYSKWVPPAKVAQLTRWLASDEASHVTGALIPVYGEGL